MASQLKRQKTVVVGAGPVGALAALYAAQRDHDVEIYELRSGTFSIAVSSWLLKISPIGFLKSSLVLAFVLSQFDKFSCYFRTFMFFARRQLRNSRPKGKSRDQCQPSRLLSLLSIASASVFRAVFREPILSSLILAK